LQFQNPKEATFESTKYRKAYLSHQSVRINYHSMLR
jgi:hypothetical protein